MLGFSSAEITNSSLPSAWPFQRPWQRSGTRPALCSNWGSRGNPQLQCRQGRIASSFNQRQIVVPLIRATRPRRITSLVKINLQNSTRTTDLGQGCFEGLECPIRNKADSGQDQAMPKENTLACVGVNIGALTVKVVALRGDDRIARVIPHQGRPLEVLKEILAKA